VSPSMVISNNVSFRSWSRFGRLTVVIVDGNEVSEFQVTSGQRKLEAGVSLAYPASEEASEEIPSWRHPSPRKQ
jgi:hypothetical protein